MKLNGKLSISRPSYSSGKEAITIKVMDEDAHLRILELEVPLENMMKALTGLSGVACEINMIENERFNLLGKELEIKTIFIDCTDYKIETVKENAKEFEIDGWKADGYYLESFNHHRCSNGKYEVNFSRYVDKED